MEAPDKFTRNLFAKKKKAKPDSASAAAEAPSDEGLMHAPPAAQAVDDNLAQAPADDGPGNSAGGNTSRAPAAATSLMGQWTRKKGRDCADVYGLHSAKAVLDRALKKSPDLIQSWTQKTEFFRVTWKVCDATKDELPNGIPTRVYYVVEEALHKVVRKEETTREREMDEERAKKAGKAKEDEAAANLAATKPPVAIPVLPRAPPDPAAGYAPSLPLPDAITMPSNIRSRISVNGEHVEESFLFASFACNHVKDDFDEWIPASSELDSLLQVASKSKHFESQTNVSAEVSQELHRILHSGEGGAYRALARQKRIKLIVGSTLLTFAVKTGRLLTDEPLSTLGLGCPPESRNLPDHLSQKLADEIAASGKQLDEALADADAARRSLKADLIWGYETNYLCIATTAMIVIHAPPNCAALQSAHAQPSGSASASTASTQLVLVSHITVEKFSDWKEGPKGKKALEQFKLESTRNSRKHL